MIFESTSSDRPMAPAGLTAKSESPPDDAGADSPDLSYLFPGSGVPATNAAAAVRVGLAIAHRAGSLALILLIGAVAALVAGKHAGQLLFWTVGIADLGLLGGAIALFKLRNSGPAEARNASLFNLLILTVSVTLFLLQNLLQGRI